ncbi:hypothetical protein CFO_g2220 [Ceratocystis platani]|uniref:Uncharacterized protein n=1 Tax=Ceratocystis fimbriata f. sp. platani TaxID=88771 RepID=A0A0F8DHL9_CERFI|nr:hypothetical protein CFO_g2220 [Ceratocystis platani]
MDLTIRTAGRDDVLDPSLRTGIASVETHLNNVVKATCTLDPAAIDLISHGIILSSMPVSFITAHFFNILRLAISALAVVPDAAPLCNTILEPLACRLPFPAIAPLLQDQDLGLLLSLDSHPAVSQLLLGIFTRVAPTGRFEMPAVWHAYISPQRTRIVELWMLHPNIRVAQAAEDCIAAFIRAALEHQNVDAMALFDDIVHPNPDAEPSMISLIRGILTRPNITDSQTPGNADAAPASLTATKTADPLTSLGRVLSLLPRILPADPIAIFKSELINFALTVSGNPEDAMLVEALRSETLVLCLRALFAIQIRDGSLPPGTIRMTCEALQKAGVTNANDSNQSLLDEIQHRLSRDWGDEDEDKRFRQWVALAFGIDSKEQRG